MDIVRTGMSDGTRTEIARSRNLEEGMKVITGTETSAEAKKNSDRNSGPSFGPGRSRPF
jgi:hypothetical protein